MKKAIVLVVLASASMVFANVGDSWTLPVAFTQNGTFTVYPGQGGAGVDAYEGNFPASSIARVYWDTGQTTMPTTTELYTVSYWMPTVGNHAYQPIESQFRGSAGEIYPIDPLIPWEGSFGTNHQYAGAYNKTPGDWYNISASHVPVAGQMYLTKGSYLYVKWDYATPTDNTVGAIRLTQVTPEPAAGLLLLLGLPLVRRKMH